MQGHRGSTRCLVSMPMYVVHIGDVGMSMFYPPVLMGMSMGLTRGFGAAVLVVMMFVVHVRMRMRHRLMYVFVFVAFGQMQPNANAMTAPAANSWTVTGSPSAMMAAIAPRNGAVAK